MSVEEISEDNLAALTSLALELWPDCSFDEEFKNYQRILAVEKETCFLIKKDSHYIGFIQLSLRSDHVEGTNSPPVAYIEGLYVKPEFQKLGIGKKLVDRGEDWGREKGCTDYASDTELTNQNSIDFHKSVGFAEVNRIVCFAKKIEPLISNRNQNDSEGST